jgi:hypothetical protein
MAASAQHLVLRPVAGSVQDWVLRSCPGHQAMGPNNSFKGKPLRGSP